MPTDTHINTRQIRLPIRTHVRLALLAIKHGFTAATMADIAIEWFLETKKRADIVSATAHLHEPRRRLPSAGVRDPLDEQNPPSTRQTRFPLRTHERLVLLAKERQVFLSTALDDLLEAYMIAHGDTEIFEQTDELPEPPRSLPRPARPGTGEIAGVAAETGELDPDVVVAQ